MSTPWSDNPSAPQVPYVVYLAEKANFAGTLASAVLYGVAAVLFFRSMKALLNPVDRTRREVKWPFVAHTMAMFLFLTIFNITNIHLQSISYIDNREFSGGDVGYPGPIGYQLSIYSDAINVIPFVMILLNQWLADGLLLYRCYIIYAMSYWVIALPILMYLASVSLGIIIVYYQVLQHYDAAHTANIDFGAPYYSISLALNVLLTLMIVVRLIIHSKDVRSALGSLVTVGGLYRTVVVMLVESCALYAVSFILYIGPWATHSPLQLAFLPIVAEVQVIAPFLIILRVANRSALTSDAISGAIGSIHFRSQRESFAGNGTLPVRCSMIVMDTSRKAPGPLGIGVGADTMP